jgi:hypothetical protein
MLAYLFSQLLVVSAVFMNELIEGTKAHSSQGATQDTDTVASSHLTVAYRSYMNVDTVVLLVRAPLQLKVWDILLGVFNLDPFVRVFLSDTDTLQVTEVSQDAKDARHLSSVYGRVDLIGSHFKILDRNKSRLKMH